MKRHEIVFYRTGNTKQNVEMIFDKETFWLSQKQMAELFGVDRSVIAKHIKNILAEEELDSSTCAKIAQVGQEGDREVTRQIDFFNLDMVIAVGYRVSSAKATQFRIWATERLKEYIIKGFTMDDERLASGKHFGEDYFKELLGRIRTIRNSERKIYQQITDIFAECSIDYDKDSSIAKNFYALVQNKFHYAITGQTAAEIVHAKADKQKPNMGLTTWKNSPNGRIYKSDVEIAKNYLSEAEIKKLERLVSMYFDYIENIAENKTTMTMIDLQNSITKFLEFNEYRVLDGLGKISHKQALQKAHDEYEKFKQEQDKLYVSDFDRAVKELKGKK